jgi:hypothetical protein
MKHNRSAKGRSNQNSPEIVWLYLLTFFMRIKYSKSGVMLPTIKPVAESLSLFEARGKTIAG